MHQITLNIGLNVGRTEPSGILSNALVAVGNRFTVESVAIVAGEWDGVPERCLVITARKQPFNTLGDYKALCHALSQDVIAVSDGATIRVYKRDGSTEQGNPALFHYDLGAHSAWQPE